MAEKSANVSVQTVSPLDESNPISNSPEQSIPHYASGIKLVLTTVGLSLTIFCIALDSTVSLTAELVLLKVLTSPRADHRDRHPKHYRRLLLYQRHRLVRVGLLFDNLWLPAPLWQTIYLLLSKAGFRYRTFPVRDRIRDLRRGAYQHNIHHWQSYCRMWMRRAVLWCAAHYRGHGTSAIQTHIYWPSW